MFPHERSLVERYKKDPFVLLGVNLDPERITLRRTQERNQLNWRNWWDGDGHISKDWKVQGMPTLYLIDAEGTIRYVHAGAPPESQLERQIDTLVREAKKSQTVAAR